MRGRRITILGWRDILFFGAPARSRFLAIGDADRYVAIGTLSRGLRRMAMAMSVWRWRSPLKTFLLGGEGIGENHLGGREISEDELVTPLGHRGRRRDVDDEVKGRTLSPSAKLFMECAREVVRPIAKGVPVKGRSG
jgi:hypothetical protein